MLHPPESSEEKRQIGRRALDTAHAQEMIGRIEDLSEAKLSEVVGRLPAPYLSDNESTVSAL